MQEVNPNPCRFCGHAAEADHRQGYCMYPSGKMDHQAAIYCTSCSATMTLCRTDTPELNDDERMAALLEEWNCLDGQRSARIYARNQALEEAANIVANAAAKTADEAVLLSDAYDAIRALKENTDGAS